MARRGALLLLSALIALALSSHARIPSWSYSLSLPSMFSGDFSDLGDGDSVGTRWAVLIAGSSGYWNYRHQADVCHAYHTMIKHGLKEENIIVFMYDDIAYNEENPRPGIIINHPQGEDVYAGVPKDYVGDNVNVENFLAVLLGNKSTVTGGSGKVVDSGPSDHIFVFYSDHGAAGVLGMPTHPYLYADELVDVLKKKHASGTYKRMVFYIEASESGSIFEGLLPEGLNIHATTAANAVESSWATYCPGGTPSTPPEFDTCLGDLYSVSWMEDRLQKQLTAVNQRDADLVFFWNKYLRTPEGSPKKLGAQKQLFDVMAHRVHVDKSMELIGKLHFGSGQGPQIQKAVRHAGQPLVDDWACLKSMVRAFETHCGSLNQYGMKHMRSIANICNAGIKKERMAEVSAQACDRIPAGPWSSLLRGFSA